MGWQDVCAVLYLTYPKTGTGGELNMDINKLRSKISLRGITQAELARKIGISENTMSAKLNNRGHFDTLQVASICEVLHINDDREKAEIFLS